MECNRSSAHLFDHQRIQGKMVDGTFSSDSTAFVDPFKPIILTHSQTALTAHVIPLGVNVTRLLFQDFTTGQKHDVIAGPENERDHWTYGRTFLGPLVGRYANRLPAGKSSVGDNQDFVDLAEFSAPGVSHHGGPELDGKSLPKIPQSKSAELMEQKGPLDRLVWSPLSSEQSQFFSQTDASNPLSSAIFGLLSKGAVNGQKGFPGTIRLEVKVSLCPTGRTSTSSFGKSAGALRVEYAAQLVQGEMCTATPLNLTHHWGFNLSASDRKRGEAEKGIIDQHLLRMYSPKNTLHTLALDEQCVPTGSLITCTKGDEHDWLHAGDNGLNGGLGRALIRQSDGLSDGYDHYYTWGSVAKEEQSSTKLTLHAQSTGITLAFTTNQSGVQVYTANGQPEQPAKANLSGGQKKLLHAQNDKDSQNGNGKHSFVALEFAHPHATFLHKAYRDIANDDTILRSAQRYNNWVNVELFQQTA